MGLLETDRLSVMTRHAVWAAVAVFSGLSALLCAAAGLSIEFADWHLFGWSSALIAVAVSRSIKCYTWIARFSEAVETLVQVSIISVAAGCASYALAALTKGYADDILSAADHALGFDWVAAYNYVGANKLLSVPLRASYLAIFYSPSILICWLFLCGRGDRARTWVMVYALSLGLTLAIFPFFPAKSALVHYFGSDITYMPATGIWHVELIEKLRSGLIEKVHTDDLAGMITFPSFHAAIAVLFIWASLPVPVLRMIMLIVNGVMLVATPIEGTHYLVDVIGGVGVAALSILCVQRGRSFIRSWGIDKVGSVPSLNNLPEQALR
jgi:PAP2 superfamily